MQETPICDLPVIQIGEKVFTNEVHLSKNITVVPYQSPRTQTVPGKSQLGVLLPFPCSSLILWLNVHDHGTNQQQVWMNQLQFSQIPGP